MDMDQRGFFDPISTNSKTLDKSQTANRTKPANANSQPNRQQSNSQHRQPAQTTTGETGDTQDTSKQFKCAGRALQHGKRASKAMWRDADGQVL
jgi:hypothetical protein